MNRKNNKSYLKEIARQKIYIRKSNTIERDNDCIYSVIIYINTI